MKKYLALLLASSIIPMSSKANSNNDIESLFEMDIDQLLSVNISVASRSSLSLSDAPASISIFTSSDIKLMGINNLNQLLNHVPGYLSDPEDLTRSHVATIRGRRVNNFNPDILVMIDSMPINNPVTGGGFYNISELSLANIARIEIIRGPGSALYGSNAFSGVINLITDKTREFITLTTGQYLNYDSAIKFNHQFNDLKVSSYLQLSSDNGHHYDPIVNFYGDFDPRRDPKSSQNAQLSFNYHQFTATLNWSEQIYRDFVQWGVPYDGNLMDRSGRFIHLKYQQTLTEQLTIDWFAEHMRATQDERVLAFPAHVAATEMLGWTDGSQIDFLGGNRRQSKQWRTGFDANWIQNNQLQWQFGMFTKNQSTSRNVFHGNWDAKRLEESGGLERVPSTTGFQSGYWLPGGIRLDLIEPFDRDVYGAYVQNQWKMNQDTQFTAGIRYDHYEFQHDNISFRGALVHNLSDTQNFKLLYGEAFRAPSIVDTQAEFSSAIAGNPDLKPERIKTFDIIWQQTWQSVLLSSNLFYSTIHDEVKVEENTIIEGINPQRPINKGTKTLSGLEFEVQADLAENFRLRAGFSWFNHKQGLGSAKALAFMSLNMNFESWQVNLNGHYRSKVLSRDGDSFSYDEIVYLDDYSTFNAKVGYHYNQELELFLKINNIANEQYNSYSTSQNLPHGLPQRGRDWQLGASWRF